MCIYVNTIILYILPNPNYTVSSFELCKIYVHMEVRCFWEYPTVLGVCFQFFSINKCLLKREPQIWLSLLKLCVNL